MEDEVIPTCSICLESFGTIEPNKPSLLLCGHSYHRHCIEEITKTSTNREIICPLCRSPTPGTASSLKFNFSLLDLLEGLQKEKLVNCARKEAENKTKQAEENARKGAENKTKQAEENARKEAENKTKQAEENARKAPYPIPGVRYYIKLKHSDKFFHPLGGSKNPSNNTPICFHQGSHESRLQFVFEGNQLKHYLSGKYIHPLGGRKSNNVALCFHDGNDGDRTSCMVVFDFEYGYLYGGGGYFVHPCGGSNNPPNNTKAVWHQGNRPGIAIELIPA